MTAINIHYNTTLLLLIY